MHHVSINIRLSFSFVNSLPYFPLITNALARRQECAVAYSVLSKTRRESLPDFRMWHIPGLIRSLLASCTSPFLLQSTLSLDSTLPLLVPFLIFLGCSYNSYFLILVPGDAFSFKSAQSHEKSLFHLGYQLVKISNLLNIWFSDGSQRLGGMSCNCHHAISS